jgi:hypothetical protein
MVEGHVPQGVWVQLPPSALYRRKAVCFFAGIDFKDHGLGLSIDYLCE